MNLPRTDDARAVLALAGHVPNILHEAIVEGFYQFSRSRDLDPDRAIANCERTRKGDLSDRISAAMRNMVDAADSIAGLRFCRCKNDCGYEVHLDPFLSFRIKSTNDKFGARTQNVETDRQVGIKSPPTVVGNQQLLLPLSGAVLSVAEEDRTWLTATLLLDDVGESIEKTWIGIETLDGYLWREQLPPLTQDVLASLPTRVADHVRELRARRIG